jgi:hypothetical protein
VSDSAESAALLEPGLSSTHWWSDTDGQWFPPYDGKTYGLPQWHAPMRRQPGLPVGRRQIGWQVAGLTFLTLGIYRIIWEYRSFKDLKAFAGEGIGGGWGLFWAIIFPVVNSFKLPAEIGRIQRADNDWDALSGGTGLWVLLPIVGWIVWTILVQDAMNRIWDSYESAFYQSPTA